MCPVTWFLSLALADGGFQDLAFLSDLEYMQLFWAIALLAFVESCLPPRLRLDLTGGNSYSATTHTINRLQTAAI